MKADMPRTTAQQSFFSINRPPRLKLLVGLVCFLLLLTWYLRSGDGSSSGASAALATGSLRYGIMMDAGSTGSRTHVFAFTRDSKGTLTILHEEFMEVKPGLSEYADNPEAGAASIVPLMEHALNFVPSAYQKSTPIALKATAGLRILGEEKSRAILEATSTMIRRYPFATAPNEAPAVIMDGKDEGPFAWVTVNFLLESLQRKTQTAAILDMGGGSTQVVFKPSTDSALSNAPREHIYEARLGGIVHRLYQHSYLGLGLRQATKQVKQRAVERRHSGTDFPCYPNGYTQSVSGDKLQTAPGKQSFDGCVSYVAEALFDKDPSKCPNKPCAFGSIFQPSLTSEFTGPIYAFSYFYDYISNMLPKDGIVTVGHYRTLGNQACNSDGDQNKGEMCLEVSFLYAILSHGYGLRDAQTLHVKKKINDIETAWALGALILEKNLM